MVIAKRKRMGVCSSTCGETQPKFGVVTASISRPISMEHASASPHDPNMSLKKFLHCHAALDLKRSLSSPRTSCGGESQIIPHSSELFSLPVSDIERTSCGISSSPARTSRASASSRMTSSPKSRNSFSSWGGRFSIEKASRGSTKRVRPARSPSAMTGDQDLATHQRLVEAIARLEGLNDGKNRQPRDSSCCRSDLARKAKPLLRKSVSRDLRQPDFSSSRSRHVRHYQFPLEHPKSTMCPKDHDSRPKSAMEAITKTIPATFSQVKTQESHPSLARPAIKKMPLEKSVKKFLQEKENFVSLIEAPWLSLSSKASRERKINPLTTKGISKSGAQSICALPGLPSHRSDDSDSDEMFTIFEAPSKTRRNSSTKAKSLQQLVQSATNGSLTSQSKSPTSEKDKASLVLETTTGVTMSRNSSPKSLPVDPIPQKTSKSGTMISKDGDVESGRRESVESARPALIEFDTDIVPATKMSLSRLKAVNRLEAERSCPLDANEVANAQEDLDMFRGGSELHEASRNSNSSESRDSIQATVNGAESTELGLLLITSSDNKPEQAGYEQREVHGATDLEPSSTAQVGPSDTSSSQSILAQDWVPTTISDSSARECMNILDDNSECPGSTTCRNATSSTDTPKCMESTSVLSPGSLFCTPELDLGECPSHGSLPDDTDSQRFLFRAYNRLVTLLHCSITDLGGVHEGKLCTQRASKESSTLE